MSVIMMTNCTIMYNNCFLEKTGYDENISLLGQSCKKWTKLVKQRRSNIKWR